MKGTPKFTQVSGRQSFSMDLTDDGLTYALFNPGPHKGNTALESDHAGAETALRIDRPGDNALCFVLNGDHREAYQAAAQAGGINAVMKVFKTLQPEYGSTWPTPESFDDCVKFLAARLTKISGAK